MKTVMEETRENFGKTGTDTMTYAGKKKRQGGPSRLSHFKSSGAHWKARFSRDKTLAIDGPSETESWAGQGSQPRYTFTSKSPLGFI